MDFWSVIEKRHSVREFCPDKVPTLMIERALSAAAAAPSAMNSQPWKFYVCTGDTRHALGHIVGQATVHLAEYMDVLGAKRYEDAMKWYSSLGDAPVVIVVATPGSDTPVDEPNKLLSVGAAIENLLLACTAQGLAACNVTFAAYVKGEIATLVELPESHDVVALVAVGYPTDVPPAAPPHITDVAEWLE